VAETVIDVLIGFLGGFLCGHLLNRFRRRKVYGYYTIEAIDWLRNPYEIELFYRVVRDMGDVIEIEPVALDNRLLEDFLKDGYSSHERDKIRQAIPHFIKKSDIARQENKALDNEIQRLVSTN